MKYYYVTIEGFKKVYKILKLNSINPYDPIDLNAYLLRHYGNFSNAMSKQVLSGKYDVKVGYYSV